MPRTRTYTHKSGRGLPTSHACLLPTPKHPPGLRRRIAAVDASTKPGPALPAPTPGSLPSPTGIPTSAEASGGPLHIPQSPRKQLKSNHHKHSLYNQPQPAERGCLSPPLTLETRIPPGLAARPRGLGDLGSSQGEGGCWSGKGGSKPSPRGLGKESSTLPAGWDSPTSHPIPSHPVPSVATQSQAGSGVGLPCAPGALRPAAAGQMDRQTGQTT